MSLASRHPTEEPTEPFTHHLRRIGAFGLVLTGLLGVLAVIVPPWWAAPGRRAGDHETPVELLVDVHPGELDRPFRHPLGGGTLFLLMIILPFLDHNPNRFWRRRPVAMGVGALVVLILAMLTILMFFSTAKTHLEM
jgi:ubiquinol-cytochrome c reductase cytochrome b subunit